MVSGWTIFGVLLVLYILVAFALTRRRDRDLEARMDAVEAGEDPDASLPTFELAGPFLMWRTQLGKDLIERVSAPKRFWERWGDASIVVTVLAGLLTLALLVFQLWFVLTQPQLAADNAPEPVLLLGIPGVNPLIPIWYGIFALVVALVIHEGSHGILTRVADLRIKSLGLVMFILPIGAFVEPDEDALQRSTTRESNRVFAAGPMSNIVLGLAAAVVFSTMFMGALAVENGAEGVGVAHVVPGQPADQGGMEAGTAITYIEASQVTNLTTFSQALEDRRPGDQVTVLGVHDGEPVETTVTLADQGDYYREHRPDLYNASMDGEPFLGVNVVSLQLVDRFHQLLSDPLAAGVGGVLFYVSYPFLVFAQQLDLLNAPLNDLFVVSGPLAGLDGGFWILANTVYWLFWINLMLGTFNALPAGPLDGGHMFKTTLRSWLMDRVGVDRDRVVYEEAEDGGPPHLAGSDDETQRKVDRVQELVSKASWTMGLAILGLILLPIMAPALLGPFL